MMDRKSLNIHFKKKMSAYTIEIATFHWKMEGFFNKHENGKLLNFSEKEHSIVPFKYFPMFKI